MGQIGTIELDTQNSGTVTLPVFDKGDSGSSVYEFIRVDTDSGTGFIPFVNPSESDRPYLRLQTQSHGVLAAHSESSLQKIVDDFNDGDISEYNGDTGRYTTGTNTVYEGTHSLEMGLSDSGSEEIYSTSGLDNYPSQGDTFQTRIYQNVSNGSVGFMWGLQDSNNYYRIDKDDSNNETQLEKYSGGSGNTLDTISNSGPLDSWEKLTVDWGTDGSMTVDVSYSSSTLTATDTEYTSGGIGWRVSSSPLNNNTDAYADLYEII